MGYTPTNEATTLLPHHLPSKPLKFPLGLVSEGVRPYLELIRLEKPTGTILMFWPFAWGLTMAAYRTELSISDYRLELMKCFCAAFIVRSSACTVNDIFDRKMDAGVERTKNRPLASGRISVVAATVYLMIQYIIGIAMFLSLNSPAVWFALGQLLPIFAIYPLLKRVTYWPQAWLGFAMNFGYVVAWAATTNSINVGVNATMMAACWCWTMLYDTIYACQDKKDDVKMGVRSTALLFGSWIRPLLVVCAITFVIMLTWAGILNEQGRAYFILSVGGTAVHLVWQFATVDLEEPSSCWRNFKRNGHLGWTVWGGIMLDYIIRIGLFHNTFFEGLF